MDALAIFAMAYDTTVRLGASLNYARALAASIRRLGVFEMDGLHFFHRKDIVIETDFTKNCRHTLVFELAGTGKQYRVTIEPVDETHRSARQ